MASSSPHLRNGFINPQFLKQQKAACVILLPSLTTTTTPIQLVTMSCLKASQSKYVSHPTPPHSQAQALTEAFVMP